MHSWVFRNLPRLALIYRLPPVEAPERPDAERPGAPERPGVPARAPRPPAVRPRPRLRQLTLRPAPRRRA